MAPKPAKDINWMLCNGGNMVITSELLAPWKMFHSDAPNASSSCSDMEWRGGRQHGPHQEQNHQNCSERRPFHNSFGASKDDKNRPCSVWNMFGKMFSSQWLMWKGNMLVQQMVKLWPRKSNITYTRSFMIILLYRYTVYRMLLIWGQCCRESLLSYYNNIKVYQPQTITF